MDVIHYLTTIVLGTVGPWGSPLWFIIGACVVTIMLARWARAIRQLLPFLGAFTLIALCLWALVGLGIITITL